MFQLWHCGHWIAQEDSKNQVHHTACYWVQNNETQKSWENNFYQPNPVGYKNINYWNIKIYWLYKERYMTAMKK